MAKTEYKEKAELSSTNLTEKAELSSTNINVAENADAIWRAHAALDRVYRAGFSKDNPAIVAQFMQAQATQTVATELAALREVLASGSGGLTIGIEK